MAQTRAITIRMEREYYHAAIRRIPRAYLAPGVQQSVSWFLNQKSSASLLRLWEDWRWVSSASGPGTQQDRARVSPEFEP